MKSNKGFTLIELVIVIIVLGVLAAIAVPKFINIHSDARKSTLDGFYGALLSTNSIVVSKAIIEGIGNTKTPTKINGSDIEVLGGQLALTAENIEHAMQIDGYNLLYFDKGRGNGDLFISLGNEKTAREFINKNCFLMVKGNTISMKSPDPVTGKEKNQIDDVVYKDIEATRFYSGC